ncbi:hypothetical protein AB0H77_18910 [Streptomyces sp. NPDC050844]|uniref:hypothetical protein n=1 Tax=Streptomyces sp. NPDC050844 TaxID=3155790 RepID=UPI0033EB436F
MGRPLGALKGRTEEANEFAHWLRRITTGVTVRTLEEDFPYGKSSWSGFRDGSRLPPADLVEKVAARYLREPVMRQRQLEHGLSLWRAAEHAAKSLQDEESQPRVDLSATLAAQRRLDPVSLALLRLDDARLRQIEAMQKLAASERRREELDAIVSVLEQRITVLEGERDRAREEVRAELQGELRMSREFRRQAGERLNQARHAVERARQLRLTADKQVAHERYELLRVEGDHAADTTQPLAPGGTVAEELQLPPLHRIQEFLDANQQQMDTLNDELDDLSEELGNQPTRSSSDDSGATRILKGQVIDEEGSAEPLSGHPVDNPRKPLTSRDSGQAGNEIGPAGSPAAHPETAAHHQPALSRELAIGLSTVSTPDALSGALSQLLHRSGVESIRQLTAAMPSDMKDEVLRASVGRWVDGNALPDTWPHLEALVRLMGATEDEAAAFHRAYERIVQNNSAAWDTSAGDLADLTPFVRGLHHILRTSRRSQTRAWEWLVTSLSPAAIVTLTTAYATGFQVSPHPGMLKMAGFGTALMAVCLFILCVTTRVVMLCARTSRPKLHKRISSVSLAISVMAVPAGLATPSLLGSDAPGRWFAQFVGLL